MTDDDDDQFVAPPFPSRESSIPAVVAPRGRVGPHQSRAVEDGFRPNRGPARDPGYYRVAWSLGRAAIPIGGAILTLGIGANRGHIGADPGIYSIAGSSLAAVIAGAGVLLLVDVARNLRRLRSLADRDSGID